MDERAYPEDIGSTLRYQPALAALPERHPLPPPLGVEELDEFLARERQADDRRLARFETLSPAAG
ncbi:hypothetical protein [Streptomyces sp. DSM 40750]|uniref:hypothetical protein n=1 Tax=Streptomyces sp. DSM 40750 TaxID=2801030 RepID=UPI00214CB7D8|nr:hypothetical protein [Streptomyces sp. DSM 40750]UUU19075.1 hypothetical protein JIX55_01305 [Streptomyces sp. DSM 40750]UUU27580.1 hypothetical protein JIX55_49440 [Streptomyces sp. DSM 40750]